jgi:antitoxin component YwqK of YwqJK toxin-antitoxin module
MNRKILLLLFCFFYTPLAAQNALFEISIDGKKAGEMKVAKVTYINNRFSIDVNAYFQAEGLATNTIKLYATSFFKKNTLTDSESILERNGKIREKSTVRFDKGTYTIERKNEKAISLSTTIDITLNMLFFVEPKGLTKVFAERYGNYCDVKMVATGTYDITPPLGGIVRYYYQNGICIKTETIGNVQNITYKLVSK